MSPDEKDKSKITINRLPCRVERKIARLKGKAQVEELADRFGTTIAVIHDIWAKTKDRISITFLTYTTVPEGRLTIIIKARVKETLPDGTQILDELQFTHGELIPNG